LTTFRPQATSRKRARIGSTNLTRQQLKVVESQLVPTLGYLTRLLRRMDKRGFRQDRVRE
jgi:hypothetical protein